MIKSANKGFTLVEVLIALVILSISLTAIVKATSSDIENTFYLKQKALAHLVAYESKQLIELNAINFNGNSSSQETKLGEHTWQWHADKINTNIKGINEIKITVFFKKKSIITEQGYKLSIKK